VAKAAFNAHIADCAQCRAEVRALSPVVAGLALAAPQVEPSTELRDRVLGIAHPAEPLRMTMPPRVPASSGTARWGWLAAAAAVVIAVGLGAYAMQLQGRIDDLSARLETAERTLAATRTEVVEARRALGSAESSVRVMLAPDLTRVSLAGQPPSQAAQGRAFYSPTTGLVFTAANLPSLPASRVFQLWIVTARAPVSAGLLAPDSAGVVATTLPAPPISEPPVAFAVTIEPAGGVPAPTGDKVLVGVVGN
jgi:anti-sigma-K factor RskA